MRPELWLKKTSAVYFEAIARASTQNRREHPVAEARAAKGSVARQRCLAEDPLARRASGSLDGLIVTVRRAVAPKSARADLIDSHHGGRERAEPPANVIAVASVVPP
jgi:hypothetical protein